MGGWIGGWVDDQVGGWVGLGGRTGADGVDGDAPSGEFLSVGLGQPEDTALGGRVVGLGKWVGGWSE